jgi:pimeloyl-ACP methyl ester carboxylesterase
VLEASKLHVEQQRRSDAMVGASKCFGILFLTALASSSPLAVGKDTAMVDDPAYTHAQRLVEIEPGRKLNLYCTGRGSPTVVFDSGVTGETVGWALVQPAIAAHTRACSYDRAGVGFSDPGRRTGSSANIVDDLHRLLIAASIAPPYVLVGHSYGGMNVRLYKDLHPSEVVGMVLVDPVHEDWPGRVWKLDVHQRTYETYIAENFEPMWQGERECVMAAAVGFVKETALYKQCVPAPDPRHSDAINAAYLKTHLSLGYQQAQLSEDETDHFASSDQVRAARTWYGDMPLIVLAAGDRPGPRSGEPQSHRDAVNRLTFALLDELAALSSRGVNRVVPDTGHDIPMDQPQAVNAAILEVMADTSKPK